MREMSKTTPSRPSSTTPRPSRCYLLGKPAYNLPTFALTSSSLLCYDAHMYRTEIRRGDDVVVENNGSPVARIVPYVEPARRRTGGFARGMIWASEDCWDPDPELERLFYGGDE